MSTPIDKPLGHETLAKKNLSIKASYLVNLVQEISIQFISSLNITKY
jgi:hypothetical protein